MASDAKAVVLLTAEESNEMLRVATEAIRARAVAIVERDEARDTACRLEERLAREHQLLVELHHPDEFVEQIRREGLDPGDSEPMVYP